MGEVIAIIPARGGSKRIPGKNIRDFHGRPMISYPIEVAKQSGLFDRILISTDSLEVQKIAKGYGAEAPFIRPPELSDDFTPTAPVLLHSIEWLEENGIKADIICCIYPTTPFLKAEDLKIGFDVVKNGKANAAFSVTTFPAPIFRALQVTDKGALKMFWPENEYTRSNDLPQAYHDAGMFYWLETKSFRQDKKVWAKDAHPVIIPRFRVQDIDNPEDWEVAEKLYSLNRG